MIQLNLLPDLKKEFIVAEKSKALVMSVAAVVTLGAIGLTVLLFIYATFVQQLQINAVSGDIQRKSSQLNAIADLPKYLTIQNQLQALPTLHDQKGNYARLFDFLPVLNPSAPNDVKLSALQLDGVGKTLLLTGTTSNFQSLNVFVDTLNNAEVNYNAPSSSTQTKAKLFSAVAVQNSAISRASGAVFVAFTLQATYNDAAFNVPNSNVTTTIPNVTTTPSVTDSPQPPAVFDTTPKAGGQ